MGSKHKSDIRSWSVFTCVDIKKKINKLESTRFSTMLRSLKEDEDRLKKCIDDVEDFHRDMFLLVRPEDAKDKSSRNGMNNHKYSVAEPEGSANESEYVANESEYVANESEYVANESEYVANESEYVPYEPENVSYEPVYVENESDYVPNEPVYVPNESDYEPVYVENESVYVPNDPECVPNDPECVPDESNCMMDVQESSTYESADSTGNLDEGMDGIYVGVNVSVGGEDGYSTYSSNVDKEEVVDMEEVAKKILLKVQANEEKEITKLVLRLIFDFSRFQQRLREAEEKVKSSGNYFPGRSNVPINKLINSLIESVLHLDKTLLKIYTKYSQLLEKLDDGS